MTVETKSATAANLPVEALGVLRPMARLNGHAPLDSSMCRFAVVELAKRLRNEPERADGEQTREYA